MVDIFDGSRVESEVMRRDATKMQRTCMFALLAIISLFVTSHALAATIWEGFGQESQDVRAESQLRTAVATSSDTTAVAPVTNSAQLQLMAIQPTVLSAPSRNAYTYTYRSALSQSAVSSRRTRRAERRNRRTSPDPIVRTVATTTVAAAVTPDSGNAVLMMGGALAVLLSIRALRSKKLAH